MSGRTLPATPAPTASIIPVAKKTNVGAIAGGAVGGVVVLIGVIAGVLLCLRRRRHKTLPHGTSQAPEVIETMHTRSPDMASKSTASASVMRGSTLASPTAHSPTYSPQGSPPPASSPWRQEVHMPTPHYQSSPSPHHQSGDWSQQAGFAQPNSYPQGTHTYQQTYFPPPPEPSTYAASPNKESFAHMSNIQEMPNVRSPANVAAEMSEMGSLEHRR